MARSGAAPRRGMDHAVARGDRALDLRGRERFSAIRGGIWVRRCAGTVTPELRETHEAQHEAEIALSGGAHRDLVGGGEYGAGAGVGRRLRWWVGIRLRWWVGARLRWRVGARLQWRVGPWLR